MTPYLSVWRCTIQCKECGISGRITDPYKLVAFVGRGRLCKRCAK